jgi:hypothetical protein
MEISGISSKIKKLNFNQNQYPTIVVAAKVVVVMLANNQQITKKQRRDFLFFKKQNMYVVKRWPQRAGNVRQITDRIKLCYGLNDLVDAVKVAMRVIEGFMMEFLRQN